MSRRWALHRKWWTPSSTSSRKSTMTASRSCWSSRTRCARSRSRTAPTLLRPGASSSAAPVLPSGEIPRSRKLTSAGNLGLRGRTIGGRDMLNSQDIRRFQERLKAERDTIESRIATNKRGIQETVRDESGVGDFEDDASLISEREAEIDENDRDQKGLAQVKRALERIEHGTYGLSEVSGKPIPIERLEAVPYATTLVDERPQETE